MKKAETTTIATTQNALDDFAIQITRASENGNLVVVNKNKAVQMLTAIGVQPAEASNILNLAKDSIANLNEDVKYSTSAYKSSSTNQLLSIDSKEFPQPTPEATFDNGATKGIIFPVSQNVKPFSLSNEGQQRQRFAKKAETSTTATTQNAIGDINEISAEESIAENNKEVNTQFSLSKQDEQVDWRFYLSQERVMQVNIRAETTISQENKDQRSQLLAEITDYMLNNQIRREQLENRMLDEMIAKRREEKDKQTK